VSRVKGRIVPLLRALTGDRATNPGEKYGFLDALAGRPLPDHDAAGRDAHVQAAEASGPTVQRRMAWPLWIIGVGLGILVCFSLDETVVTAATGMVFTGIALYGFYWVIRLAVRDGMLEADRSRTRKIQPVGASPPHGVPAPPPPGAAPATATRPAASGNGTDD
jgi:hypothetical protein